MDAIECLSRGDIILLQTDTIWGVSCDATDCAAVKKVLLAKRRDESSAMIILVSGPEMLSKYAEWSHKYDITKLVGVSLVLPYKGGLCSLLVKKGTVCARIPDSQFLRDFISRFGKPIVSTSANIHKQPAPASKEDIPEEIVRAASSIVENPANTSRDNTPSTVVDLSGKEPVIVREGRNLERAKSVLKI
ncbi:MAG: L-threonylcarbamoyladenylate synthase [Candidatus Micrarchaeota archaeon]|nr:L-threonylcarbamoyladenylate synthase [Candidatus Micrarchaeota archaeon]